MFKGFNDLDESSTIYQDGTAMMMKEEWFQIALSIAGSKWKYWHIKYFLWQVL